MLPYLKNVSVMITTPRAVSKEIARDERWMVFTSRRSLGEIPSPKRVSAERFGCKFFQACDTPF